MLNINAIIEYQDRSASVVARAMTDQYAQMKKLATAMENPLNTVINSINDQMEAIRSIAPSLMETVNAIAAMTDSLEPPLKSIGSMVNFNGNSHWLSLQPINARSNIVKQVQVENDYFDETEQPYRRNKIGFEIE